MNHEESSSCRSVATESADPPHPRAPWTIDGGHTARGDQGLADAG